MGVSEEIKQRCGARRIVIAGGGTGGHLFPGIAIAEALLQRCPGSRILFVSSGRPLEEEVLSKTGFENIIIRVEGIKGKRLTARVRSALKLPAGFMASIVMLIRFRPHLVIGMGGYTAGPVLTCAWMLRIPRVIHEQNSLPGLTNRLLAGFADRIYVSFKDTKLKAPAGKIRFFGNPVRKEILSALQGRQAEAAGVEKQDRLFTVLILGGSQGAHSLNRSAVDAGNCLAEPEKIRFVHQTGSQDAEGVRAAYQQKGIGCIVEPFFDDMADRYREADLVVCRAGATTVAEVSVAGCAVIFVPFPYAADRHQEYNARGLVDAGAAEMILQEDLSGRYLAERIAFYAKHPEIIKRRRERIREFGMPDAADRIADDLCGLMGQGPSHQARAA